MPSRGGVGVGERELGLVQEQRQQPVVEVEMVVVVDLRWWLVADSGWLVAGLLQLVVVVLLPGEVPGLLRNFCFRPE